MRKKVSVFLWSILIFAIIVFYGELDEIIAELSPGEVIKTDIVAISVEQQYEAVRPGSKSALAICFELKDDWHFYASEKSAPGGVNLKVKPSAKAAIIFGEPIFPASQLYYDENVGEQLEVFSNKFTVFVPFSIGNIQIKNGEHILAEVRVGIEGALCSGSQCRVPDFGELTTQVRISNNAAMNDAKFDLPDRRAGYSTRGEQGRTMGFALLLALAAGLSLNIMPCIWPVLPVIVMRIIEQAKQNKGKSVTLGLAFCLGILLFFACLAGANIVLRIFYGTVLQWGDQFRSPAFVGGMAILLVALAMFMFGVFTIKVPASIAGKSFSGTDYAGSIGMGFLAAILSTPCSFGILAAAFAWAQSQSLLTATLAIMTIGVGMAVPYAILTSMPSLLGRLPKAGHWMEIFKQSIGFVLLIIAVKLITALPEAQKTSVMYFVVILAFCIWMWSGWVDYNTGGVRRRLVRTVAVVLAVAAGWLYFSAPSSEVINWQPYDSGLIEKALAEQRPVLIKFTADWCLSCRVVDKWVYHRKDIAELIEEKNVLAIKADTTVKDYPATYALKNVYNEPGVPVSMLFVPGVKEPARWRSMYFGDELKKAMEGLASK